MKLICPPENWQNAHTIDAAGYAIIQAIASSLDIPIKYDASQDKVYLGQAKSSPKETASKQVMNFVMRLPKQAKSSIIDGVLMFDGQQYKATSGLPGYQAYGKYWDKYCPIPEGSYRLDLSCYMCETPGIEGLYYHILPDPIVEPNGTRQRTEIGLHKDNGAVGTAGCIGVVGQDWSRLRAALCKIAKSQRYLDLVVSYKCQD